jgi:hypothetical protein
MEDVLKLYEQALDEHAPVVCIDEKPVVLREDTRPTTAMQPGQVARRDYEYKRRGTANVFCGIEPRAGRHFTRTGPAKSRGVAVAGVHGPLHAQTRKLA